MIYNFRLFELEQNKITFESDLSLSFLILAKQNCRMTLHAPVA